LKTTIADICVSV